MRKDFKTIKAGYDITCKIFFVIVIFTFISFLLLFPQLSSSKESKSEMLKKKIVGSKKKLSLTEEKETTTLMQLNKTLTNFANQKKRLSSLQMEEGIIIKELEQLQFQIKEEEKYLSKERETVKKRMSARYKVGSGGYVEILFSAKTPLELLKTGKYVDSIVNWDKKALLNYESKITSLKNSEKELEIKTANLKDARAVIEKQKEEVLREKRKTENVLASIRKDKIKYQREVQSLEILTKKIETKIEQLQKSSKKGNIIVVEPHQKSNSLLALKGKLHPPVKGDIIVDFGKHKDPVLNVVSQNKGIIIDSKEETKVRAIYKGKVIYADWLKGYGNLIVIDHGGNIYSLYARCMKIFVNQGDYVKDYQVIGSLENDKKEKSYLYFELRLGTKPVNPSEWIAFSIS